MNRYVFCCYINILLKISLEIAYVLTLNLICTTANVQDELTAMLMAILYPENYAVFCTERKKYSAFFETEGEGISKSGLASVRTSHRFS